MGFGMRPLLISASMDSTIRLWDVATQKQVEALQYKESQVNSMCITPDGAQFLIGAWQNLRIFDLNCLTSTGLHNSTVHEKNVTSVGFQADGAWMYTGGEDCMAKIWDMRINQLNCQRIFQVNTPVHSIALHPNQVELLIADSTGAIYLWDLRSDRDDSLITEVDLSEYVVHIDIDKSGNQCAAVTNRGRLFLWDISHKGLSGFVPSPLLQLQSDPNTVQLAQQVMDDYYTQPTIATDAELPPIAPPPTERTDFAPQQLLEDQNQATTMTMQEEPSTLMGPPKPEITQHSSINLVQSAKFYAKLQAHNTFALKCRFRPDGMAVATTSADQTTKLWSVGEQKLLNTYSAPGSKWVWDCAFTNDSAFMLTATSDGILRMWNLASNAVVRMYQGHSMGITAMAFKDF